jgi:fucose 4-O-acetylase-like acetyltransferase
MAAYREALARWPLWTSGAVVAFGLLLALPNAPAVGIALGAVIPIGGLLIRADARKPYAAVGTAYVLSVALFLLAVQVATGLPTALNRSLLPSLFAIGGLSFLLVATKAAGRRAVRALAGRIFDEAVVLAVYDALASVAMMLGLAWTVLRAAERVGRYLGVSVGGATLLVLNVFGVRYPASVGPLNGTVDLVVFFFVGCVLLGFYIFESLNKTWYASKATAKKGVDVGSSSVEAIRNR